MIRDCTPADVRRCPRPTSSTAAARALSRRLHQLYEDQRPRPFSSYLPLEFLGLAEDAPADGGARLEFDDTVTVGPYAITPVRTNGAEAVDELNRYLRDNGFVTEDPAHLRWFAENDFTFLCIQITPPEGSLKLGAHLDLPPLQIGFDTERPYYPGMYSANQGDFALELTTLTTRPLATASVTAVAERLRTRVRAPNLFTVNALPAELAEVVASAAPADGDGVERWFLNRYSTAGFNRTLDDGRPAISTWREDVFWELGGAADEPPSWYHGDGARPLLHPHNVRPVLLILGAVAAVLLGWFAIRRPRRPRRPMS